MTVSVIIHQQRRFPDPGAVLTLLKPHTWFPPMWAFSCGAVATGISPREHWGTMLTGIVLTGPLVCATSQAVNDWFDRHVDAINEPQRPIPSGRVPGRWGLYIAVLWTALSLLVAATLGPVGLAATAGALALAWAYSAPPFRLKQNGWFGNAAVGLSYEGLAWVTGGAVLIGGALPSGPSLLLAVLYSVGTHGIMTLNDFKSYEGDRRMGIGSLPVRLGMTRAAWLACGVMLIPQFFALGLLASLQREGHAVLLAAIIVAQVPLMGRFLQQPRTLDTWYNVTGVPVFVSGMMVSAFAVRTWMQGVA